MFNSLFYEVILQFYILIRLTRAKQSVKKNGKNEYIAYKTALFAKRETCVVYKTLTEIYVHAIR